MATTHVKRKLELQSTLPPSAFTSVSGKLKKPAAIYSDIIENTCLIDSFCLGTEFYIYNPQIGIYQVYTQTAVIKSITEMLKHAKVIELVGKSFITDLIWFITMDLKNKKEIDYYYLTFKNGHLNLRTG